MGSLPKGEKYLKIDIPGKREHPSWEGYCAASDQQASVDEYNGKSLIT
jgi:hypothetical protein